MNITRRAALAAIPVAGASVAGCATLSNIFSNSSVQLAVQTAIDLGVGLVLANNPTLAAVVETAATALESLASGSGTTVATLEADADTKIAALNSLNAPEKLALQQIITLAANAITTGQKALPETAAVVLETVFTDIANAAAVFTGMSAKAAKMGFVKR